MKGGKMKLTKKLEYIQSKYFSDWLNTRHEVENEFSEKNKVFCLCGKLATGLHEKNCRKFNDAITKEAVKRLEHLILPQKNPTPQQEN
jgi:CRISPR/Cas system CSM-associated protein Csm4 (group 5 of RAMP superfamily)